MDERVFNYIREECEILGVDPAVMLSRTVRSNKISVARAASIKRVRKEMEMSIPAIARLFGLATATVWTALRNEPRRLDLRDAQIIELWNTMSIMEVAIAVGLTEKGLREARKRLGLPPYQPPAYDRHNHRAFTPRCAEILRQHGVFLEVV